MGKKITSKFILLLIIGFLSIQCSEKKAKQNIIGEWKAGENDRKISVVFDETDHAIFIMDNQVLGGDDFKTYDGKKTEVKYELDESKKPSHLDLVFYDKGSSKEKGRMPGIFRYLTKDKIEWRMNFEGQRFEEFDPEDKGHTAVLERNAVE